MELFEEPHEFRFIVLSRHLSDLIVAILHLRKDDEMSSPSSVTRDDHKFLENSLNQILQK